MEEETPEQKEQSVLSFWGGDVFGVLTHSKEVNPMEEAEWVRQGEKSSAEQENDRERGSRG